MKKFLSWLLVFAMVIGMTPAVFAAESAKEEYVYDDTVALALGNNPVTLNDTAYTTVFAFTPDEAATYTFSVPEGYLVGYWGGSEHYMWDATGDAKTTTLEQTITSVGQSIMVGVTGEGATTLTITKGNAYEAVEIELQTYVNKATPTAPNLSAFAPVEYVDVLGETTHTAVLGSDGYYHLDSADGAILIVDMDYLYRLSSALEGGRGVMYAYITDDNGNIVEKWDIGDAVQAYEAACDENGYCYLTEDLIFFYGEYAKANGVYSYVLGDSYNADCAWMFACLTEAPLAGTGTEEDPYIITSLPCDLSVTYADETAAWDGVFYQYTAEQTGVIEVANLADDYNTGTLVEPESWAMLTDGVALSVTEGDVVLLYHWGTAAQTYDLTLQYGTAPEGGDTGDDGDGTGDTGDTGTTVPDSGEWSGTDVALAEGESITIVFTPETDGVLTADITGNPGWLFFLDSEFYGSAHWSDDADPTVSENLTAGSTYTIEIAAYQPNPMTNYAEGTVSYELTWTPDVKENASGSGTDEDPYILTPNADNYAVVEGDGEGCSVVYFAWTATSDGTLTLTFDENDPQPYVVIYLNGISYQVFTSDVGEWTATAKLAEGDVIYITIETWEFVSADYTFYAAFESKTGEEGGQEGTAVDLTDGDNYLTIWAGEGTTPYTYTATQTGTLYLTFTEFAYMSTWGYSDCSDDLAGYIGYDDWGSENWTALTINGEMSSTYYGCVDVTEGDVVSIGWEFFGANDYVQSNYDLFATLNLNYEGYKIPEPGSIDDPYKMYTYDVDNGMSTTEIVDAGSSVYYSLQGFDSSTVTITGEGDFTVNVGSYVYDEYYNETLVWTTYTAEDGYLEFYADGYALLIEIVNNSNAAAAYTVGYYFPAGHPYNPQMIVGEGTWTASLEANSNGYYYMWSADNAMSKEGIMTITVSGTNGSWMYSVGNYGQSIYGDYHYSDQDGQASENWTVFAGDYFSIWVSTDYNDIANDDTSTPAGEVTITITFEEMELVQGVDYPYSVNFNDIRYFGVTPEATVAAGEEAWINVIGFSGYYLVVNGAGAAVTIGDVTYTDDDGDGVLKIKIDEYDVDATLANTSSADVTYTFGFEAPLGHTLNPEVITENGTYTTSQFPDNGFSNYYFQYTATKDGTITVEVLNETAWRIYLRNPATYASANGNSNGTTNVVTMNVSAGDVIEVYGATYDPSSYKIVEGVLSFNFTFEAAPEDTSEGIALVLGDNDVYADNTDGAMTATKYTYVAEQTGTLYLTLSGGSYTTSYGTYEATKSQLMNYTVMTVNGQALANGYYGAIEVTEGDEITITWKVKYSYYTYLYEATLNLSYEGYNPAPGSAADPIDLSTSDCPAETIEIPAGSTVYYNLKYFTNSYITVTGEGAYVICNDVTYTDEDGDGVVMLYANASPMLIQIGNSGDSTATFTVAQYFPLGSQANPEVITEAGSYVGTVEASSDGYYYSFIADCDMDLTLTFNAETGYQFAVINYTTGQIWDATNNTWSYMAGWNTTTGEYTVTFELYQGDVLSIGVNTASVSFDEEGMYGSSPAGSIVMDVEFVYYHADDDADGYCDLCGTDLNAVTVVYGDLNGDGEIDLRDANLIVAYYNDVTDLTEEQLLAADLNNDGEIDLLDANLIVSYYNGLLDSFPVEEED